MKPLIIKPAGDLCGTVRLPGDKSISHRAAMCAALSAGTTRITNFLFSEDSAATLGVLEALGVEVARDPRRARVTIRSAGILRAPRETLRMGESGTSARLLMGLLAAQPFASRMDGAASLRRRPMGRVIMPLRRMGASLEGRRRGEEEYLPVRIVPAPLKGITWRQRVASAQVKSAVLFAGLGAAGATRVVEPVASRDHTERMMRLFGARLRHGAGVIDLRPSRLATPGHVAVPGDFSSAAFFIVAALLVPGARLLIKDVNLNPTRTGALDVLKRMGARLRVIRRAAGYEPAGDLEVRYSRLRSTQIAADEVPRLIDELPVLMVAAGLARGTTVIRGVGELRVKETDRTRSMGMNLTKLGVRLTVKGQGKREDIAITGTDAFPGASFHSFGDHRTAMSCFVAGLAGQGSSRLDDTTCIRKSFPGFLQTMEHLLVR
ncbi:MAG: 3-phosphoshikimate 1-carboxyvinyltransferase [Deltaproteobacteria bacterium]